MKYQLLKELVSLYITEEFGFERSPSDNTIYTDTGNIDNYSKISKFYGIEENSYSTDNKTIYSVVFKVNKFYKEDFENQGIKIDDIEIEVVDDHQRFEHDKKKCIDDIFNIIQSKSII